MKNKLLRKDIISDMLMGIGILIATVTTFTINVRLGLYLLSVMLIGMAFLVNKNK